MLPHDTTPPARKNRSRDTITVSIDPDVREWFSQFAKKFGYKEKEIVEQLLKYLHSLKNDEREAILKGRPSLIRSMAGSLELQFWGEQAFRKQRWARCGQVYLKLYKAAADHDELRRTALYNLGYVYIEMAREARREIAAGSAGVGKEDSPFRKVENALQQAWRFNEAYLELGEHGVVCYNQACIYSLIATLRVEEAFWGRPAWEVLIERLMSRAPGEVLEEWRQFGRTWRKVADPKLKQSVQDLGTKALDALKRMAGEGINEGREPVSPTDVGEMVRYGLEDSDLWFLRFDVDEEIGQSLDNWLSEQEKKHRVLDSLDQLMSMVPEALRIEPRP